MKAEKRLLDGNIRVFSMKAWPGALETDRWGVAHTDGGIITALPSNVSGTAPRRRHVYFMQPISVIW